MYIYIIYIYKKNYDRLFTNEQLTNRIDVNGKNTLPSQKRLTPYL